MPDQPAVPNQLNIEISEEISEGVYANLAIITHSHLAVHSPVHIVQYIMADRQE